MPIPNRVRDRMASGLKRLLPIRSPARNRLALRSTVSPLNQGSTPSVTLVKEVFGYDKYAELTGENAIRGTYCDLAVKLDELAL